jgi:hypothetical protein
MKKLILLSVLSAVCLLSGGCATYKVQDDGSVMTWGFFRNLAVKNTYYESGKLQSTDVKTESTTRDVMIGANDLIDTAANTYSKVKP